MEFITRQIFFGRPETIESLFIAYRLTGDEQYRAHGWRIFQAIQKYSRLESGGYVSLLNVDDVNTSKIDKMETFFMVGTPFIRLFTPFFFCFACDAWADDVGLFISE